MMLYPWQSETLAHLVGDRTHLPHAILLHGHAGSGKYDFAQILAQSLLCQASDATGLPCGQCASCSWYAQSNHPDFRLLAPEEGKDTAAGRKRTQISVDQVRALSSFLELSSHHSDGLRLVLVHPAESLNPVAANSLLKMLEEPPAGVIFILVTHQLQRLLATIVSRCQKIAMRLPSRTEALEWLGKQEQEGDAESLLDYVGGAPLSALQDNVWDNVILSSRLLSQGVHLDPFAAAAALLADGMESAIDGLQKWTYDLLACRLTGVVRYYSQSVQALQTMAESVDLAKLLSFQRQLNDARKAAQHPLNQELQLETLLLVYTQMFTQKTG